MATGFTNPFVSGANLNVTPRLMTAYEEWREDACALEARRVERDLGGLRQECEAFANAKDWREFNSASQAVVCDFGANSNCSATLFRLILVINGTIGKSNGASRVPSNPRDAVIRHSQRKATRKA